MIRQNWGLKVVKYVSKDRGSPFTIVQNKQKTTTTKEEWSSDNWCVGKVLSKF